MSHKYNKTGENGVIREKKPVHRTDPGINNPVAQERYRARLTRGYVVNFNNAERRGRRREEATRRNAAWASLTTEEKVKELKRREKRGLNIQRQLLRLEQRHE